MAENYKSDTERAKENYTMFAAQGDSGLSGIADILARTLGESLRGPLKDLGMVIQALAGVMNKGVSGAVSVLGGLQQYGAPGIMPGGGSGLIGGRDVTTVYAAQAIQTQLMSQYTNPTTGAPMYGSRGLNQAQLGQSAAMAFRSGIQYSGGNIFDTHAVDQNYINQRKREAEDQFRRSGRTDYMKQAQGLKVGGTDATLNWAGKEVMSKAMDDANAVLAGIRDVMGGKALENLEETMGKLFGGDAAKFGLRAARLRMMNIQAIAPAYGEGQEGAQRAAAALAASAQVIGSGNTVVDQHAALQNERMAMSGSRASLMNAGIASGRGYSLPAISHAQQAQITGSQTGAVLRQETEFVTARLALQFSAGGTPEQRAELRAAVQEMQDAGGDETRVNAARSKALRLAGALGFDSTSFGSPEDAVKRLSPENAEQHAGMGTAIVQKRNQGLMRRLFRTDNRYTGMMGLSSGEAEAAGLGAVNMNPMLRAELGTILDEKDPVVRAAKIAELRRKNPDLDTTLGTSSKAFWGTMASGKVSGRELEILSSAPGINPETAGFIGIAAQQETAKAEYANMIQSRRQNQLPGKDFLKSLTEGLIGTTSFSDTEIMNKMLLEDKDRGSSDKRVQSMTMDRDRIAGTKENLAALRQVLTPEQMQKLGISDDPDAALAWLKDSGNAPALLGELSAGGLTMVDGTAYATSKENMLSANKELHAEQTRKEEEFITGKDIGIGSVESEDEYAHSAQERVRKELNTPAVMKGFLEKGLTAGADTNGDRARVKKMLGSDMLSEENRNAADTQLQAMMETTGKEAAALPEGSKKREELNRRFAGLKELQERFTSGLGEAAKQVGTMIVNSMGSLTINGQPKSS